MEGGSIVVSHPRHRAKPREGGTPHRECVAAQRGPSGGVYAEQRRPLMVVVQAYVWVKLPVVVLVRIGLRVRVRIGVRVRVRLEAHVVVVLSVMSEVLVGVLGSTCLRTVDCLPLTSHHLRLIPYSVLLTCHLPLTNTMLLIACPLRER